MRHRAMRSSEVIVIKYYISEIRRMSDKQNTILLRKKGHYNQNAIIWSDSLILLLAKNIKRQ